MNNTTVSIRALSGAFFWITALVVASLPATSAARAEVTVSRANEPTASIGGRLTSLLGVERSGVARAGTERLAALADGVGPERRPGRAGAEAPAVIRYDAEWLDQQPAATGDAEWECLAKAVYFEARGETIRGQFAVAEVILNRVSSPAYPSTVCAVVNQGGSGGCQFSYICDRLSDRIREVDAYRRAGKIARLMLDGAPRGLTQGATYFHTVDVNPRWARSFQRTAAIGAHLFYRKP